MPLIVSAPKGVPVSVEVHDDDTHIRGSPDIRPIRPIHLVPIHDKPQAQPRNYDEDDVFKGPVAVPKDEPFEHHKEVSPIQKYHFLYSETKGKEIMLKTLKIIYLTAIYGVYCTTFYCVCKGFV